MHNTKYYKELIIYYSNNLFPIVINIEKKEQPNLNNRIC